MFQLLQFPDSLGSKPVVEIAIADRVQMIQPVLFFLSQLACNVLVNQKAAFVIENRPLLG